VWGGRTDGLGGGGGRERGGGAEFGVKVNEMWEGGSDPSPVYVVLRTAHHPPLPHSHTTEHRTLNPPTKINTHEHTCMGSRGRGWEVHMHCTHTHRTTPSTTTQLWLPSRLICAQACQPKSTRRLEPTCLVHQTHPALTFAYSLSPACPAITQMALILVKHFDARHHFPCHFISATGCS
jgi:hypothetical protein